MTTAGGDGAVLRLGQIRHSGEIPSLDNQRTTGREKHRGGKERKNKLFLKSDTQTRGGAALRVSAEIIRANAGAEVTKRLGANTFSVAAAQHTHGLMSPSW